MKSSMPSSPKSTGKRRSRSNSRERVLEAARGLFSRKGFAGTSMDEIASRAKASPSSIYWHFKGGKDDIVLAVIEEAADSYTKTILGKVREGQTQEERLERFIGAALEHMKSHTETLRLIIQLAIERSREDPAVRDRIRGIYRKFRDTITAEMTEGFPGLDPEIARRAAAIQIGVFEGIFLQWQLDPEQIDLEGVFALLMANAKADLARQKKLFGNR